MFAERKKRALPGGKLIFILSVFLLRLSVDLKSCYLSSFG